MAFENWDDLGQQLSPDPDSRDEAQAVAVVLDLLYMRGTQCPDCGKSICGHEAIMSLAMGFKNAPMCCPCLAIALNRRMEELRDHLLAYIKHRPCHYAGWESANRNEGFATEALPSCLWPPDSYAKPARFQESGITEEIPSAESAGSNVYSKFDEEWDAGDLGCGDLVLQLRLRLQPMQSHKVLKLTARDPGAVEDIPAWCRMTGHLLVASQHPTYWIQRKEQ